MKRKGALCWGLLFVLYCPLIFANRHNRSVQEPLHSVQIFNGLIKKWNKVIVIYEKITNFATQTASQKPGLGRGMGRQTY